MSQQTAKRAIEILIKKDSRFYEPKKKERANLSVAFARKNMVLYGRAFDVIKRKKNISLENEENILKNIDDILIYEIKSTENEKVGENFEKYFFSLSTAELLVAQSLNDKFKFIFVNTLTEKILEFSMKEVFQKATKIYPTWSISF